MTRKIPRSDTTNPPSRRPATTEVASPAKKTALKKAAAKTSGKSSTKASAKTSAIAPAKSPTKPLIKARAPAPAPVKTSTKKAAAVKTISQPAGSKPKSAAKRAPKRTTSQSTPHIKPQAKPKTIKQKASAHGRPSVNLALQGGGSHGAFTWGVIDRLLEDDGLDFAGVSGTSAGALNGAVLLTGYVEGYKGGDEKKARKHAQKALHNFWRDVSQHGPLFSPLTIQSNGLFKNQFNYDQFPAYQWLNVFMRSFSPYQFNPLNLNPLKDVLYRHVDVEALHTGCQQCGIPLFVTATSVRTGQARVFSAQELSLDALMASACVPFVFQAVEIDGEPYWDGGYTGNPALFPLIYNTALSDIMLVRISPLHREDNPTQSIDIIDRLSEITFNASLIGEMRAISFVKKLIKDQRLDTGRYKNLHMHMIDDDHGMTPFNASSKFNTDWAFLQELHRLGHRAANNWLAAHRNQVGRHSTFDIDEMFLNHARATLNKA